MCHAESSQIGKGIQGSAQEELEHKEVDTQSVESNSVEPLAYTVSRLFRVCPLPPCALQLWRVIVIRGRHAQFDGELVHVGISKGLTDTQTPFFTSSCVCVGISTRTSRHTCALKLSVCLSFFLSLALSFPLSATLSLCLCLSLSLSLSVSLSLSLSLSLSTSRSCALSLSPSLSLPLSLSLSLPLSLSLSLALSVSPTLSLSLSRSLSLSLSLSLCVTHSLSLYLSFSVQEERRCQNGEQSQGL